MLLFFFPTPSSSPPLTITKHDKLSLKFHFNIFVSSHRPPTQYRLLQAPAVLALINHQCWFWDRVSYLALLTHLSPSFLVFDFFFLYHSSRQQIDLGQFHSYNSFLNNTATQCECNTFSVSLIYLAIDHLVQYIFFPTPSSSPPLTITKHDKLSLSFISTSSFPHIVRRPNTYHLLQAPRSFD